MRFIHVILAFSVWLSSSLSAQQNEAKDSVKTEERSDTTAVVDSLVPGEAVLEDLTESQRKLYEIEKRRQEFKEKEKAAVRFSFQDSLTAYLVSERFNKRAQIDQSFYHDAGDYFKFDPSYFILDHQVTPMRKTVRPFGMIGDRLNVIVDDVPLRPFEHTVEPDGLTDLNDIPTAMDGGVYIFPGPAGRIWGGHASLATLLTLPPATEGNDPLSTFMADKGFFGYSYVRGRYTRQFSTRREIDLSLGTRDADGAAFGWDDDFSYYSASVFLPFGDNLGLSAAGQMQDRDGGFAVRPDIAGTTLSRDRFDRSLRVLFDFQNESHSARTEVGYKHLRQGSSITSVYRGSFNRTGHGAFASHERKTGLGLFKAETGVDVLEYDNGFEQFSRTNARAFASVAGLHNVTSFAFRGGIDYSENFSFLPSMTTLYQMETEKFFIQISATYSEREPTLHELHLPFQQAAIYGLLNKDYSESGNPDLKKEKQLIGSLTIEPGSIRNRITLNVTGGKINDAIEWSADQISGTPTDRLHFSPVNDDVTFVSASINPTINLGDFLSFNVGAVYYNFDYETLGERPYRPDYNLFSGLGLHYFWADRLVDLYAYGELSYSGPYDGYDKQGLGEELLANAKLSLGLKDFRFHFVFQNVFDNAYEARENLILPGRFFYYGLTWNFHD